MPKRISWNAGMAYASLFGAMLLMPDMASAQVHDCTNASEGGAYEFFVESGLAVETTVLGYDAETNGMGCKAGCKQTAKACSKAATAFYTRTLIFLKNVLKQAKKRCGSIEGSAEKKLCKSEVKTLEQQNNSAFKQAKLDAKVACQRESMRLACTDACVSGSTSSIVACSAVFP